MVLTPDLFLNVFSELTLSPQQRNLLLAAFTAAKKMSVAGFLPIPCPDVYGACLCWTLFPWNYLQLVINGAKTKTLKMWSAIFDIVKSLFPLFDVQFIYLCFFLSFDLV